MASREPARHIDGTRIFTTPEDAENENVVARALERAWGCEIHHFGALTPIDYYAMRHGRMTGLLELKARTHTRSEYPTVFLSVRKWLALTMGSQGLGVPSVFVVRFADHICWIPIVHIDARKPRIAGTGNGTLREKLHSHNMEPIIHVPVASMYVLNPHSPK